MVNIFLKPSASPPQRSYKLIAQGLRNHPEVNLVATPDDCDYVFYMCSVYDPHVRFETEKTVHIDFRDMPQAFMPTDCQAYFKRSWVTSERSGNYYVKKPKRWPGHFHPISYAIMDEFIYPETLAKDIEVGCYLRPNQTNRSLLLLQLSHWAAHTDARVILGPVNDSSRSVFDADYLRTMARTKIVVTCNPDRWEGDSRTWEALANRCLVFVDRLYALQHFPLQDGQHCIFFTPGDERGLIDRLNYYLKHQREAAAIAYNGFRFAMAHHRTVNRAEEIIAVLNA